MSQHRNGKQSLSGPESVMEQNIDYTGVQMRERERWIGKEKERAIYTRQMQIKRQEAFSTGFPSQETVNNS